jgi:hypothetical protein
MRTNGGQRRPHQQQRPIGGLPPRDGASTSLEGATGGSLAVIVASTDTPSSGGRDGEP